ncbi:MAG: NAD-dependent epimerase/dehydratase family protein [Chroococcus sp. CMT-3BRIN-NPC107]|jgi:hypothetical protein|nr:NAD-dependent epimerase/dehydratase family protein [Chroococcus sp. CMT-3BRIN-NPC107]
MNQTKRSGDVGRFVKTLADFEIIPFIGCLQRLLLGNDNKDRSMGKSMGIILVAGATGGVGKRVVQKLVDRGYLVWCLVRNCEARNRARLRDRII